MTSLKQITTNRKNSKKSTGPVIDIGKAKVSINAIKHGLYAEHHIAVNEVKKDLNCGMGFINPNITINQNSLGHSRSWKFKKQKKYNYYD